MKQLKKFFVFFPSFLTFFIPPAARAGDVMLNRLSNVANHVGFSTVDTTNRAAAQRAAGNLIGDVIAAVLSFVGVVFILLIIYAGYMWMTAAGNEEQVKKAQKIIRASVVGILVIALAYAVTAFVGGLVGKYLFQ